MITIDGVVDDQLDVPVLVTIDDSGSAFALREATVLRGDLAFRVYQSCDGPMYLRIESMCHHVVPGPGGYASVLKGECEVIRGWRPIAVFTLPGFSREHRPTMLRECLADAQPVLPLGTIP